MVKMTAVTIPMKTTASHKAHHQVHAVMMNINAQIMNVFQNHSIVTVNQIVVIILMKLDV